MPNNKYFQTNEINDKWSDYDRSVAKGQLSNYGTIYLDNYGLPIDDVFITDELHEMEVLMEKFLPV